MSSLKVNCKRNYCNKVSLNLNDPAKDACQLKGYV